MRGTDQLDSQYLFPKVGESETRGQRFKVRGGEIQKGPEGHFFHTEGGECLERAARGSSRGGYNFIFEEDLHSYMGTMGIERYGPNAGNWD